MLRIAKSSPGVLDLSAIKDELGIPVILNGASHRDVPDHEQDNPILQRVLDMQWITVTQLPIAPAEAIEPVKSMINATDDSNHQDEPSKEDVTDGQGKPGKPGKNKAERRPS